MPADPTDAALKHSLGPDLFTAPKTLSDWPRLRGVQIAFANPNRSGEAAWHAALNWLRDFRQGEPNNGPMGYHSPDHARVKGQGNRPSISNWPEADKVRQLSSGTWTHTPKHNAEPVWPRAALGLPIIAQFQRNGRNNVRIEEPGNFELHWLDGSGNEHDRLSSPLIVGAMPVREGTFVPFALWLGRGYPAGAQVVVVQNGRTISRSAAAFDELVAPRDTARFDPLAVGQRAAAGIRMQTAFFDWLTSRDSNIRLLT